MKLWTYSQINVCSPKSYSKIELDKPLFLSQLKTEHLTNMVNEHYQLLQQSFPKEEQLFAFPGFNLIYNLNTS